MVLGGGFLLLLIGMDSNPAWLRWPWSTTPVAVMLVGLIYSAGCLTRLTKGRALQPRAEWIRSLLANAFVVAIVIALTTRKAGLVLCTMELLVIALHVYALTRRKPAGVK